MLTSPVAGYIEGVHFKVGDIVKKGDLLVSLDQREILMKRAQSIADRASQTNDVRRYEAEGKLTDMRLAQLSVKKAEAQINLLDYQLDKALIESPFDGSVLRMADQQQSVLTANNEQPLLLRSLYNTAGMQFVFPETAIKGTYQIIPIDNEDDAIQDALSLKITSDFNKKSAPC